MKNDLWAATENGGLDDATERSPLLDAKVMMVDDDGLMTDLIQTHLEDAGYRNFVVANDPRDALAVLRRERPAVLLLDLLMPQLSGFDVLKAMRADAELRYTPVIVLTAASGADAKLRALRLGASDFLSKPVDPSELLLRVRNTLAFHEYHHRLIHFDGVTGLANQRLFDRALTEMVARRETEGGLVALLMITVPDVVRLGESLGPQAADGLARVLARRLDQFADALPVSAAAAQDDRARRVARLGRDQFGVLLDGARDADAVEAAALRLLAALDGPADIGVLEVVPKAWLGIALAPHDGVTAEALRKGADIANAHARAEGAPAFKFASRELNARSHERMTLGLQLRGAAHRGELVVHYQPKVDVAAGRIVGAEALVRWQHPQHGLLPPARFIGLAEELGVIAEIGQWVLERACQDAAAWTRAGLGELKIAVNVARPQFSGGSLAGRVRQALFDSGLSPRRLVLELTESMLMDDVAGSRATMQELKALGVTLSIDDFGTGYSSLSYLRTFPLDELKVDRSFIADLPGGRGDLAIVQAVIELGHSLGLTVTAEGVESDAQWQCLRRLKCDQFQGFVFSTPLPMERFMALQRAAVAAA